MGNFGRFSGCSCQKNSPPGYETAPKWLLLAESAVAVSSRWLAPFNAEDGVIIDAGLNRRNGKRNSNEVRQQWRWLRRVGISWTMVVEQGAGVVIDVKEIE